MYHYRKVADQVTFEGVLLEKRILESIITAAEVHVNLLVNPPLGVGFPRNSGTTACDGTSTLQRPSSGNRPHSLGIMQSKQPAALQCSA